MEIKLDEIIQADIGGVAAWELGFEQSEVWNLFKNLIPKLRLKDI